MKNIRRKHTSKFKAKVAIEAIKEQESLSELASKYNLHPNQISSWKKAFLEGSEGIFKTKDDTKKSKLHEQELQRMLLKIGELQMDNDFLKKNLGMK
jgi:transposase-like protein